MVIVLALVAALVASSPALAQVEVPRIFLDQPERIVEYQLNRLTREQLIAVERRDSDPRYRPVYLALLTRDGMPMAVREEAAAALAKLGGANRGQVLLEAIGKLAPEAETTAAQLTRLIVAQPRDELGRQRSVFAGAIAKPGEPSSATAAAYAGLLAIDADTTGIWSRAAAIDGHLEAFLKGAALLPAVASFDGPRGRVAGLILQALQTPALADPSTRAAALIALAAARLDAESARAIARELRAAADDRVRAAAVRALGGPAAANIPDDQIEPAIEAVSTWVASLAPGDRTAPDVIDALALAEALAGRLPAARATPVRRAVRSLGAQVVRIGTLPEQVSFDVRWFAVEAGRSVQIVLVNSDAMPHNVVIGKPGSLQAIGTAAGTLAMPADPEAKPFVPDLPEVLFSTRLAQQDETVRLSFVAPKEPGAYVFACTFPGHWLRMYGVMLVVPSLEVWEAAPAAPDDPMTGKPFPFP